MAISRDDLDAWRHRARYSAQNTASIRGVMNGDTGLIGTGAEAFQNVFPAYLQEGGENPYIAGGMNLAPYASELGVLQQLKAPTPGSTIMDLLSGLSTENQDKMLARLQMARPASSMAVPGGAAAPAANAGPGAPVNGIAPPGYMLDPSGKSVWGGLNG